MRTYKPLLLLSMIIALMLGSIGCSSEDVPPESTAEYHGTTVNFYGMFLSSVLRQVILHTEQPSQAPLLPLTCPDGNRVCISS
jgi:hypothetical protein